ncbi:MAG: hypothetical protein E4H13_04675 [Calditrichales bacterium]|nr:MAG: hypothetical protein E4H13_04675 [Calditrichales bacterium]
MDNQRILTAGFLGGLVAGVLNSVPFLNFINCFCCLGIMLGGVTAVIYYDRTFLPREYINPATAVTLGITAGLFGAFISLFIEGFIYYNYGHWELGFMQQMMENMDEIPAIMDDLMIELEDELRGGFMLGSIMLRNLLIMPLFCLAGALASRVLINKNRL